MQWIHLSLLHLDLLFAILKTHSGLLQSPWAPLYIALLRGPHPYAFWSQQVTSPTNGGHRWALTSQSPNLPPLWENGEKFRWFGGIKEAFKIFLMYYFNWRLISLQYCSGFCHLLAWISHGFTCVSHPELPSHLPPHPISLGRPSAPAFSTLSHASNLDWPSVSRMIIYIIHFYSLRSSHPGHLPQSPKDCSIHLCLFCCLTYRVIVTIFLNSIYMH